MKCYQSICANEIAQKLTSLWKQGFTRALQLNPSSPTVQMDVYLKKPNFQVVRIRFLFPWEPGQITGNNLMDWLIK